MRSVNAHLFPLKVLNFENSPNISNTSRSPYLWNVTSHAQQESKYKTLSKNTASKLSLSLNVHRLSTPEIEPAACRFLCSAERATRHPVHKLALKLGRMKPVIYFPGSRPAWWLGRLWYSSPWCGKKEPSQAANRVWESASSDWVPSL